MSVAFVPPTLTYSMTTYMSFDVSMTSYRRMMCGCMKSRKILISRRTAVTENRNQSSVHTALLTSLRCTSRPTFLLHVHVFDFFLVENFDGNLVSSGDMLCHLDLGIIS